jgi:radical SAM superfamily enzyme YgiQ (UPF0313 family)
MIIQLIHPPHPSATDDKLDAPLGLLYIAATLKVRGYDVRVVDLSGTGRDKEKWRKLIHAADLNGLTDYVCTMDISREVADVCREMNPQTKVIVGGANVTGFYEQYNSAWISKKLKDLGYFPVGFDAVVIGDGEEAILEVIKDFPDLAQFYEFPLDRDLDVYPNPDYEMIDVHSYHRKIDDKESISILTSRGCPFRCAFCGLPKQKRTVRYRTPRAVFNEVRFIKDVYGIEAFNFQDDTFIVNKERVRNLCKLIEPLGVTWRCLGRAGLDTKDDYKRMRDSGCTQVAWGIESGSQEILDKMNKNVTVSQNREVIQWAKELGILDRIFVMVGFPGETQETLDETKRFIEETDPSQFLASTFQPYPGTSVTLDPERFGVTQIYKDYSKYIQIKADGNGGDCNIDTVWHSRAEMSEMIFEFKDWINQRKRRGALQDYEKELEKNKN